MDTMRYGVIPGLALILAAGSVRANNVNNRRKAMRTMKRVGIGWMMGLVLLTGMMPALAAKMWNGSVSTNWTDPANWDGGLPDDTDDVVITNTTTKPSMPSGTYPATGSFNSFAISNGATVTCLGDTNAVPYGTGVAIRCQSAIIAGTLTADGQGFPQTKGPGYKGRGSHGGRGDVAGVTYGSLMQPTSLGSGGDGSAGGGAIHLIATGTVTLNGKITAAGAKVQNGAAGGSIWITANTLAGTGTVSAAGGDRGDAGGSWTGGGGGRMALEYVTSTFSGIVSVAGGKGANAPGNIEPSAGQPGTLWEPQRFENVVGTAGAPRTSR